MIPFSTPNRIAFIGSYPAGRCPIARFTTNLVENMIPASYGAFEPVMVVIQSDISRDCSDEVNFVIRRDFRSDYMEAADFINAGHGDLVMLQHHFDLFGDDMGLCVGNLLKKVDVPVITTLHLVPENPPAYHYQSITDVCDASERVIVMNGHSFDVLHRQYGVPFDKIELIAHNHSDNPFDRQMEWFQVGRQYWQLANDQLDRVTGYSRSQKAARELSVLFEQ